MSLVVRHIQVNNVRRNEAGIFAGPAFWKHAASLHRNDPCYCNHHDIVQAVGDDKDGLAMQRLTDQFWIPNTQTLTMYSGNQLGPTVAETNQ